MIAGMMPICDFPLAPLMAAKFAQNVDYLLLRYDTKKGHNLDGYGGKVNFALLNQLNPFNIPVYHMISEKGTGSSQIFLEEMMRHFDDIKPDYVFQMDTDECYPGNFGESFWWEFEQFKIGNYDYMMFDYEMATYDGRTVPLAPLKPHVRVYRWQENISFTENYKGFNIPNLPFKKYGEHKKYHAKCKMIHYWAFTPELQKFKEDYYVKIKKTKGLEKMYAASGLKYNDFN